MNVNDTPGPGPCPTRDDLIAFDRGGLAFSALDTIGHHLSDCGECLGFLAALSLAQKNTMVALRRSVKTADPEPFAAHPEYLRMERRVMQILEPPGAAAPATCGPYRILEQIGRGGMGTVYRAEHTRLKRFVAIKLLSWGRTTDAQAVARFQREMEAVGRLNHPNIVRATDAGEADGVHFLVMDLIDGTDLARVVAAAGTLSVPDACELARQAAVGLQSAHELGLVHRDVKPSNLILSAQGVLMVVDFGLASLGPSRADPDLTRVDQVMGTADYMAPEQWRSSHRVDIRADVYSLGCTLYYLLTGKPPFPGPAQARKKEGHLNEPPPPLVGVPPGLEAVVRRMLEKAPERRFATPREAAAALATFAAGADLAGLVRRVGEKPPQAGVPTEGGVSAEPTPGGPPRRRPRLRLPALLSLAAAAVVGAVVALAMLPKPADDRRRGVVHDVLDRPPTELWWNNPARKSGYQFEANARLLRLHTFPVALLSLGRSSGGFTLTMTLQQARWTGNFGVFFGGRKDPVTGAVHAHVIEVVRRGQEFRIQRGTWTIEPQPGRVPMTTSRYVESAPLVAPLGIQPCVMRIEVTGRGLGPVVLDGAPYPNLADTVARPFVPGSYDGQFGLFGHSGAVSLQAATFFPHE